MYLHRGFVIEKFHLKICTAPLQKPKYLITISRETGNNQLEHGRGSVIHIFSLKYLLETPCKPDIMLDYVNSNV